MATDEILTVHVIKGVPGDRWVRCPHCKEAVYLPSGPMRGEQFQHENPARPEYGCGGWFDIDPGARILNQE